MNHTELDAEPEGRASRKRTIIWASVIVGVVVVAFAVWLIVQNTSETPGLPDAAPTASASPSTNQAPSEEPVPSASPGTETADPQDPNDGTPQATQPPIDLDATGTALDSLEVSLAKIETVDGEPAIPGEVKGPALRVTVEARNDSTNTIDTPVVVVNLYYGPDRIAGNPLLQPGGQPFPPRIRAGTTEFGVYVFSVPLDQRDDIQIEVNMLFESSVIIFQGAVS